MEKTEYENIVKLCKGQIGMETVRDLIKKYAMLERLKTLDEKGIINKEDKELLEELEEDIAC